MIGIIGMVAGVITFATMLAIFPAFQLYWDAVETVIDGTTGVTTLERAVFSLVPIALIVCIFMYPFMWYWNKRGGKQGGGF